MQTQTEVIYTTPPAGTPANEINITHMSPRTQTIDRLIRSLGYARGYVYTVGSDTFLATVEADKVPQ